MYVMDWCCLELWLYSCPWLKVFLLLMLLDIRLCLLYWALLFNTSCRTSFGLVLAM